MEAVEPPDFIIIKKMFADVYKISHAEKVEVNLSVDGTASSGPQGPMPFHLGEENESDSHGHGPQIMSTPIPASKLLQKGDLYEPKIWGLRIEYQRLLWTIYIRDIVFQYVASTFVLYEETKNASDIKSTGDLKTDSHANNVTDEVSLVHITEVKSKAMVTLEKFSESEILPQFPLTTYQSLPRYYDSNSSFTFEGEKEAGANLEIDVETDAKVDEHKSIETHTFDGEVDRFECNLIHNEPLLRKYERMIDNAHTTRREITFQSKLEFPTILTAKRKSTISELSPAAGAWKNESMYDFEEEKSVSKVSSDSTSVSSTQNTSTPFAFDESSKFVRYFFIELIDPQINFLDLSSHCCFVLCAGKSSLEGLKSRSAFLVLEDGIRQKNKLELRMEGVSLYTAFAHGENGSLMKDKQDLEVNEVMFLSTARDTAHIFDKGRIKRESFTKDKLKLAVAQFDIDAYYEFATNLSRLDGEQSYLNTLNSNKHFYERHGYYLYFFT